MIVNNFFLIALLIPFTTSSGITNSSPLLTTWMQTTGTRSPWGGVSYLTDVTGIWYTTSAVYVLAQGIPSYSIGPWANPNTPSGQNWVYSFPINPSIDNSKMDLTIYLGQIGAWSNGLPVYGGYDGQTWANQGVWHRNAYFWEYSSFDACLGHPDVMGIYHNHVTPICMTKLTNSSIHSPLIGYAFDGYPIYGPYAYQNPLNASSPIKRMQSSFSTASYLMNNSIRNTLTNGTVLTSSFYGPNVNSSYPAGCFLEDWVYNATTGDLDSCNGRFCITPEYPNGTYAYFTTVDSSFVPYYPFVIGTCFYGKPTIPNGKSITLPTTNIAKYFSYSNAFIVLNPLNAVFYVIFVWLSILLSF